MTNLEISGYLSVMIQEDAVAEACFAMVPQAWKLLLSNEGESDYCAAVFRVGSFEDALEIFRNIRGVLLPDTTAFRFDVDFSRQLYIHAMPLV